MEIGYVNSKNQCYPDPTATIDRSPTVEERLLRRKSDLELQLKDVTAALEALQANPEILKIMCLISKVNY